MEVNWKYSLLLSLVVSHLTDTGATDPGVNKEECQNIKSHLRLSCSSPSSAEDRRIGITQMCLCYRSSCSSCICLKDDWDFCKGSKACTFLLPQNDIKKIESQLTPAAAAVWALIVNNAYVKVKYTCLEVEVHSSTVKSTTSTTETGVTVIGGHSNVTERHGGHSRVTGITDTTKSIVSETRDMSHASQMGDKSDVGGGYQIKKSLILPVTLGVYGVFVLSAIVILFYLVLRRRMRTGPPDTLVVYTNPISDVPDQNQLAAEKQLYESETKEVQPSTAHDTTSLSSSDLDQNDKDSPANDNFNNEQRDV